MTGKSRQDEQGEMDRRIDEVVERIRERVIPPEEEVRRAKEAEKSSEIGLTLCWKNIRD